MKLLLPLSCVFAASLAAQSWPSFQTTFGHFHVQPRTLAEAEAGGWQLLSSCGASRYAGHRYGHPDDDSIILIFDAAGYIAGAQSVVPADKVDPDTMALQPVYQLDTWFSTPAYLTTMYYVDPAIICSTGRTQQQWDAQGTGDRLVVQVGPSVDYLVSLPLSKAEAALDPAWYDHYCFAGMGDHFLQFDYTPDQDCTSVLPLQILYDDGYDGIVNGYVWQHFATLGSSWLGPLDSIWEHPNRMAVNSIVNSAPQCMMDALDGVGISTMHHYFWDYPLLILCPLEHDRTLRGYRNLMANIMRK